MAVDEAILEAVGAGRVLPTLRLFAWQPPCLSLGYAQPAADADREALARQGWDLVRRPTGGRAILHTDELTYSVSAPYSEPRLAGSVTQSYQRISRAWLQALHRLGIPAEVKEQYHLPPGADPRGAVCFEVPSHWEITVLGKKLMGSAQARRQPGILQHGTLPLHGDLTRITRALRFPDEQARSKAAARLLERATTVQLALNRTVTWEAAAAAVIEAFAQVLNLDFVREELTAEEKERAGALVEEKYGNPHWTARV